MSDAPHPKIARLIRPPLRMVNAYNAILAEWFKITGTRPIYLLLRAEGMERLVPQVIMSRLRDTYGPSGVVFSVLSEKKDRMLICAWSSNEITESGKQLSPDGQPST